MHISIFFAAFFAVLFAAIKHSDGTICYLARAKATDSQIAAWEAMLMPLRYFADHIDRATVIASAQDFSIADYGTFEHVPNPTSFKSTFGKVKNEMTAIYFKNRADTLTKLQLKLGAFKSNLDEFTEVVQTSPPEIVKDVSSVTRGTAEKILVEIEEIIGSLLKYDTSSIPAVLSELASFKPGFEPGKEDRTDKNYIWPKSLEQLNHAVTFVTKGKTTLFFYDISLRVADVRRRLTKFLGYADKAMETKVNQQPGVVRLLECMSFRIVQEMEYVKEISAWYSTFCENYDKLDGDLNTAENNYDSALKAIETKTNEARDKIKEYVSSAVNGYNKWLEEAAAKKKGEKDTV